MTTSTDANSGISHSFTNTDVLAVKTVSKHYSGVFALRNAHFSLKTGEVHALMGENGAGKSTLAKIIAGAIQADDGEFYVDSQRVSIADPFDAQRLGIGIIYQELDLFPHLSIGENIVIGNLHFAESGLVSFAKIDAFCKPYLEQVGLDRNPRELVARLSIAQMQLLAIARALSMNARIILMDEPTSSLFEDGAERLFQLITELKSHGVSIVYVSHKMDEIFRICDRITVLRDGETIGTHAVAETNSVEIIRMMVGRDVDATAVRPQRNLSSEVLLSVEHLTTSKLTDVSFDLRRGEVLGIAGLVGSGRSELGAALFGLDRIKHGSVRIKGKSIVPRSPSKAMQMGLGLVPEDRKQQGLMMQMSVLENSTITLLPKRQRLGFIRQHAETEDAEQVHGRLRLKCASNSLPVSSLSGGNQQKALLARWLLMDPDVLFLDDPARGIDVAAKQDIYRIIEELAASGKGVILVSSELPELLRCSNRILVLNNGRVAALYTANEATPEKIMAAAASESYPLETAR